MGMTGEQAYVLAKKLIEAGGGGGGTVDAYTKTQTDNLLIKKVDKEVGKGLFSGSYNDLKDAPSIPSKTSELQNDSGYLTEHQDLTDYAKKTDIPSLNGYATEQWVGEQGYLTEHQDLSGYVKTTDFEVVSEKVNTNTADIANVKNVLVNNGLSHNSIARGKHLGSFSSVSDVNTFLNDHKVSTGEFEDIYIGDYVTIQDGVYNKDWVVAGFNMYINKGDIPLTKNHIVLIPKTPLVDKPMNSTNTTGVSQNPDNPVGISASTQCGGYYGSDMNQIYIPEIVANLQTVLGDRLLSRRCALSNSISETGISNAVSRYTGYSNDWAWYDCKAVLMSEIEIYGSTIFSSSFYDIGEACKELPVFNVINNINYGRFNIWLRAVSSSNRFARVNSYGNASGDNATNSLGIAPIIIVG